MSEKVLSESYLEQLCLDVGGEIMPTLIKAFHEDAMRHIKALRALDFEDTSSTTAELCEKIGFHGHSLKGVANSIGAETLGRLGAHIETRSRNLQSAASARFPQDVLEEFRTIQDSLEPLLLCSVRALETWTQKHLA